MANLRVSQLAAAAALSGGELLLLTQPSPAVRVSGTDISAAAADNSFNHAGAGFVTAGFAVGDQIVVTGFAAGVNNLKSGTVTAVVAGKLTVGGIDGDAIVDEAAGDSVLIAKWESSSLTAAELAAYAASAGSSTITALSIDGGGDVEIDCAAGDYFELELDADVDSISFTNLPLAGRGATKLVRITQDSTERDVTWPASFLWAAGDVGAVSTAAGAVDMLAITSFDGGTTWLATLAGAFE